MSSRCLVSTIYHWIRFASDILRLLSRLQYCFGYICRKAYHNIAEEFQILTQLYACHNKAYISSQERCTLFESRSVFGFFLVTIDLTDILQGYYRKPLKHIIQPLQNKTQLKNKQMLLDNWIMRAHIRPPVCSYLIDAETKWPSFCRRDHK